MIVTIPVNWLSKALFQADKLGNPIILKISDYIEEAGSKGLNRRLSGLHNNGTTYQLDVYGDTIQTLIRDLGPDSDKWKGRMIRVMLVMKGDKEIKKLEVI